MSVLRNFTRRIGDVWGHGGDDEYDLADEDEETMPSFDPPQNSRHSSGRDSSASHREIREDDYSRDSSRSSRYTSPPSDSSDSFVAPSISSASSGASSSSARRRSSLRAGEKNIHTLRPRSMDEVSLAADYLKTGCAVVVNLEAVERSVAVRIIDFMSGVCYGLEHQGHAMKLGDTIFLFTPGEYEISSDEADYGENRGLIFKDVTPEANRAASAPAQAAQNPVQTVSASAPARVVVSSSGAQNVQSSPERRSWER